MFTGFASENTPAIQVWDFFSTFANTSAVRSVSLPDDCSPIQIFRTGATTTAIRLYLPTAPIEGKQITISNQRYGGSSQSISIYSSDVSGFGTGSDYSIVTLGQGDSIVLVYSKQGISFGTSSGYLQTGWLLLNRASSGAANSYSAVVGGGGNTASGAFSFIGGGNSSTASGTNTAVVGGNGNTASGSGAAVVGGTGNIASGSTSVVVGGSSNTANQPNTFIFGSQSSTASGLNSIVLGGTTNISNATKTVTLGGSYGTARSIVGNFVASASDEPIDSLLGRQQIATLLLGRQTTDATATVLRSNTSAASTTNQVILPNNSAYYFRGSVIANVTGGGATKAWTFEGAIKRGASAATTTIVQSTLNPVASDTAAESWIFSLSADTTNGGLAVTVTGAAATTIRWVCKIETTEVTF